MEVPDGWSKSNTNKLRSSKKGEVDYGFRGGESGGHLAILTGENTYLAHQSQQKQYLEKAQVVVTSSKATEILLPLTKTNWNFKKTQSIGRVYGRN